MFLVALGVLYSIKGPFRPSFIEGSTQNTLGPEMLWHTSSQSLPAISFFFSYAELVTKESPDLEFLRENALFQINLSSVVQQGEDGWSEHGNLFLYNRMHETVTSHTRLPPSTVGSMSRENSD